MKKRWLRRLFAMLMALAVLAGAVEVAHLARPAAARAEEGDWDDEWEDYGDGEDLDIPEYDEEEDYDGDTDEDEDYDDESDLGEDGEEPEYDGDEDYDEPGDEFGEDDPGDEFEEEDPGDGFEEDPDDGFDEEEPGDEFDEDEPEDDWDEDESGDDFEGEEPEYDLDEEEPDDGVDWEEPDDGVGVEEPGDDGEWDEEVPYDDGDWDMEAPDDELYYDDGDDVFDEEIIDEGSEGDIDWWIAPWSGNGYAAPSRASRDALLGLWKMTEHRKNYHDDVILFEVNIISINESGLVLLDWGDSGRITGRWDEVTHTLTVHNEQIYVLVDGVLGGGNKTYSGVATKADGRTELFSRSILGQWVMTEYRKKHDDVIQFPVDVLSVEPDGTDVLDWGDSGRITGLWDEAKQTLTVHDEQVYVLVGGALGGGNRHYSGLAVRPGE